MFQPFCRSWDRVCTTLLTRRQQPLDSPSDRPIRRQRCPRTGVESVMAAPQPSCSSRYRLQYNTLVIDNRSPRSEFPSRFYPKQGGARTRTTRIMSSGKRRATICRGATFRLERFLNDGAPYPEIVRISILCCNVVRCIDKPWDFSSGTIFIFLQEQLFG